MTITVTLSCDARQCHNSIELYDTPSEETLNGAGWHQNPREEFDHYCDKCWQEVKKEIEDEND